MKKSWLFGFGLCIIVGLSSCKKEDPDDQNQDEFDRGAMLVNYADNVIMPAYQAMAQSSDTLVTLVQDFNANPNSTTLNALRSGWKSTLVRWQYAAPFEFGPASTVLFIDNTNLFPVDTNVIENNISNGSWNLGSIANLDAKGLQALDYLLNKPEAVVLDSFTTGINASSRKQYLLDVTTDIQTLSNSIYTDWQGSYRSTFVNATGTDIGGSTSLLSNALNKFYEKYVRTGKVAIPSGALGFTQTPYPEAVEAYYYNTISLELIDHGMQSVYNIYTGFGAAGNGPGFDDYCNFVGANGTNGTLTSNIVDQIGVIRTNASQLPSPLSETVVNQQQDVLDLFSDMQLLVAYLKNDMMSAMGVVITYTDTDGD